MSHGKTIRQSIAEIKNKYSTETLGFIEFFDGDNEGKLYAFKLHRLLLNEEGYIASLSKLNASISEQSTHPGAVEIGDLDSGINDFHAFRVKIYPGQIK